MLKTVFSGRYYCLPLMAALAFVPAGCAGPRAARGRTPAPAAAKAAKAGRTGSYAAQKAAYDRGMKYYTQEQYKNARKAWQEAVRLGPATPLGQQAQKYLEDVEQTIKTLEGIKEQ